ncbi:glycosyltransferase family 87 protein [Rhodobacter sp. SY28-1]|uniref:glycosyltransferase family 87 protein n=1 Tax=Rhodobacter sp. SY28-1 TaxID=2562317 RepID=UPI0010BFB5A4|nr:glycosyltransferase family 87 protein [Rhodobacter sp. SY28-1]
MEEWLISEDFVNYWTASRLLLGGQVLDLYADQATYFRHLTDQFGPDYPWRNWSYPPHYLLLVWPLSLVGYVPAFVAFLTTTLLVYLLALRGFVGSVRPGIVATAVLVLPALVNNIQHAQNGFLTSALMLGGLALRMKQPILAGILIGCLTIKPQLGLLIPLFLVMERQWRVIASATVTTVVLVALSGWLFGWETWTGYVTETLPYQSRVMTEFQGIFLGMMPSVFGTTRVLQIDPGLGLTLHLAVAIPALAAGGRVLWHCPDAELRAALLVMTTLVVTPYWLTYDYGIAAGALVLCYSRIVGQSKAADQRRACLFLAAVVPLVAIPIWLIGLPIAPLLVFLGYYAVLKTAAASGSQAMPRSS